MDEKLREFDGKRIDINCGAGAVFRGVVKEVGEKIVVIQDENDRSILIAIKKIIAVTECHEPITRPGFIV
jgi:hypothetical protein